MIVTNVGPNGDSKSGSRGTLQFFTRPESLFHHISYFFCVDSALTSLKIIKISPSFLRIDKYVGLNWKLGLKVGN
jgi:hypothetical protein